MPKSNLILAKAFSQLLQAFKVSLYFLALLTNDLIVASDKVLFNNLSFSILGLTSFI